LRWRISSRVLAEETPANATRARHNAAIFLMALLLVK
jgi:hypothetical protein